MVHPNAKYLCHSCWQELPTFQKPSELNTHWYIEGNFTTGLYRESGQVVTNSRRPNKVIWNTEDFDTCLGLWIKPSHGISMCVCVLLGTQDRASCMLHKSSNIELYPNPFFHFWDSILLSCPGQLELVILLPQPFNSWDYRSMPPDLH